MSKKASIILTSLFMITLMAQHSLSNAGQALPERPQASANPQSRPLTIPTPPSLNAKAYILIDINSGKIITEKNSETRLPPASLTKLMTLYVTSNALSHQQVKLDDKVRISKKAWKTGGSRMFVKEGEQVSIENLLKGIIVDSGNDACVALAEHLSGSEEGFADLMNDQAQQLGMAQSHFTDSTGLPNANHYSTAKDLAILGRALINDYPQYYHWYKQKWFTYNGIRQPNRNRLLWRDSHIDGMKTGHTDQAGYCMVSSAQHDNMRLLAVVLGSPNETARADDNERLLNYGFRFYETHRLYNNQQPVTEARIYKGDQNNIKLGLLKEEYVTIPAGQYQRLTVRTKLPAQLEAPISKNQKVGELIILFDGKQIDSEALYALEDIHAGGLFKRSKDSLAMTFSNWFGG